MSKATILIVEDEAIVATDLTRKLQRLGYEVCGTAVEGEEAIALASSLRPHLVLMDIRLEGSMDGIEAAEAIRSRLDVPVIYLTAHSDPPTLARAKLTGPFGYILKPFEERELSTQVELALYKHQADREVREQREWLRVTLSSIGDAVIATNGEGSISFLNPVAESLTGWMSEEAMGLPVASVFRVVNEHTGQPLEDPVARVLRHGRAVELANHAALVTKGGRAVPIDDSAAPILNVAGQMIGVVLVFHDVTEKRRAEETLRQSEAMLRESEDRFRALFDQAPIPYQSLDEDGRIFMVNQAWLESLGYTRDEVVGKWFGSLLSVPCLGTFEERFPCFKGQGEVHGAEFEMLRKDGRHILVSFDGRIGRNSDGSFKQTHCIFTDITERRRMEDELRKSRDELELRVQERTAELETTMRKLEESNQALQDFASIASHDMQEPLRKVRAFGARLNDKCGVSLGEEGKDYLDRMLSSTGRMQSLLTSLLDYSRVTAKAELFRPVDLGAVVKEVLLDLEVRIEKAGGAVQVGELPTLDADPSQMRQLFQNLIGNALKFHKEGERPIVKVHCSANNSRSYEITVADNGIGFEEAYLDKIFAPFHRLHGRSSSYEGTGMGLAICKKIVERHGGTITARSAPGEGAVFVISIPQDHCRN